MSPCHPAKYQQGADRAGQDQRVEPSHHHQGLPGLQGQETGSTSSSLLKTQKLRQLLTCDNKNNIGVCVPSSRNRLVSIIFCKVCVCLCVCSCLPSFFFFYVYSAFICTLFSSFCFRDFSEQRL